MNKPITILFAFLVLSCNSEKKNQGASINDLADRFYEESLLTYPEQNYLNDIGLKDHSLVSANSLSDIKKWEDFEDKLYADLQTIDEASISEKSDRITYWLLKEQLESSIGMRICKRNLWNVNQETGNSSYMDVLGRFSTR